MVLFFGPPEIFVLAFLALTFVAVLGKEDMTRSLIAALIGLLLAMIGVDNVTNTERFTMGSDRLADGLSLVPVILGLFAVAEMIELWTRGGSLAKDMPTALVAKDTQRQIFRGIVAGLPPLVAGAALLGDRHGHGADPRARLGAGGLRCLRPRQADLEGTSETFGKGNVEGVIGPEAANDAVEGGALASTLAFGIPGSSSMAILLSGLFILGLETGPRMLNEPCRHRLHHDLHDHHREPDRHARSACSWSTR